MSRATRSPTGGLVPAANRPADARLRDTPLPAGTATIDRALWTCPSCGRTFANARQSHTCAPLGDLDRHFARTDPAVRATFDRILEVLAAMGPVTVLPEKTRIALHVRMSFAALMPRQHWLNGHLVLARRVDSPRFRKIEVYSPRNVLHAFRLGVPGDVDQEFTGWLALAYDVGAQRRQR